MSTDHRWEPLLRAASTSRDRLSGTSLLVDAVRLGLDVAPGTVGCSITELTDAGYRTPVTSGPLALELDQAQYAAGNGPCVVAARDGSGQRVDDMAVDLRYPEFALAAVGHGVRSSLSLPLVGTTRRAAINIYGSSPGAFDAARPQNVANLLARVIAALLEGDAELASSSDQAAASEELAAGSEELAAARSSGRMVGKAEDVLMSGEHLSRSEAFLRLARQARTENGSIFAVARALLAAPDADPDTDRRHTS
ncbi:MAG: hypothetical protein QOE71_4040 [Pseudonocardiales bacterium]|nr:hypothetical protein [Pseudonocardiales bacterium]